ncbi:NCS2 family permease [Polycladomyces zharkentensis]|uniref:NCS2 family permease n=1 Tax=Polycladomyces zharkentensis TaxID=2807616 RepID=UPI00265E0963|nr:NCS2 family permease [Polycladomyces sp. WAk]
MSWQTVLGAVFIFGVVFFILTVTGVRRKLMEAIPGVLQSAIGVGIGLFIAFIGLKNAGIIVKNEEAFVSLGSVTKTGPLLAILGLILAAFLMSKRVKGAFMISILLVTTAAMAAGDTPVPKRLEDIMTFSIPGISETFLRMDVTAALKYGIFSIIFSFTIVELFDNLATLIALAKKAGLTDEKGNIPNLNRALSADAVGTLASASFGSTTLNAYIENATGVAEGGRTGLSALVVAGMFLLCLFFAPLVTLIPTTATAPILVLVGALMLGEIKHIAFDDYTEVVPAFLTILMMPLTYSIAEGLAFGFLSYTLLKALTGRAKEVHWITYVITAAFVVNFALHG